MRKKMKNPGRKALAAGAVGLAAAAMVFGATTAASAATGHSNEGVRSVVLIPTGPAQDFAVPGTAGVLRFNAGDGTGPSNFSLNRDDTSQRRFTLPTGMQFGPTACDPYNVVDPVWLQQCAILDGGRTIQMGRWMGADSPGPYTGDWNNRNFEIPIVSTGLISGGVTATFKPWTGLTTAAGSASVPQSEIPGAGSLTATGATGPDGNNNCVLTGTAQPGAAITVKDKNGTTAVTGTADSAGNWSVTLPCSTPAPLSITQTVGGQTSAPIEFNTAPLPVMNGVVAAGAIALAGLGFGGARLLRRSRVTA